MRTDGSGNLLGHDVDAFYFGWTGDGHIGRFNLTHAFYEVLGHDSFNSLAGRPVIINAQMAALELSYDFNWVRLKLSGFYASGSSNPTSHIARGFDSIVDNPSFVGGPFSWYVHEGPNLAGTAVNLKQGDSLVPDLRSSKTEDQSNFVNPGVYILGLGADADVTPKIKAFANVNYIWLGETAPIKLALHTNEATNALGLDTSIGFKYRPLLTDNIIVSLGIGLFFPGDGYKDIYRSSTTAIQGVQPAEWDREGRSRALQCLHDRDLHLLNQMRRAILLRLLAAAFCVVVLAWLHGAETPLLPRLRPARPRCRRRGRYRARSATSVAGAAAPSGVAHRTFQGSRTGHLPAAFRAERFPPGPQLDRPDARPGRGQERRLHGMPHHDRCPLDA